MFSTLAIILVIILAGPVQAIKLNVQTDKAVYRNSDDIVTFTTSIDIQKDEIVPIQMFTLRINDDFKVCEFALDGSNTCSHIEITRVDDGSIATGDLQGDGFGFENEGDESSKQFTDFGYGYGFEEEQRKAGLKGELKYEIKWDIAADDVPNGKYFAVIEAFALNGEKKFTYQSRRATPFIVRRNNDERASITNKASVLANRGSIDFIDSLDEFSMEKVGFWADLRSVDLGSGLSDIQGRAAISLYGELPDSTKADLQLEMTNNDFELVEFNQNTIEIHGTANFKYSQTKKGVWTEGRWQGTEAPVNLRGLLMDIHIVIEGDHVTIMSTDPLLPFSAEFDIDRLEFR